MADEQPVQNTPPDGESRDTVRINLPQGVAGKTPVMPTPTVRLRAPGAPQVVTSEAEHKKATAAISSTTVPIKPKKDTAQVAATVANPGAANPKKETARVQMPVAKPSAPEMPRPTVKLKREEPSAPAVAPVAPVVAPQPVSVQGAEGSATSVIDFSLAIAAMVLALVVAGYLFSLNRG